jgi:hypothetical protein
MKVVISSGHGKYVRGASGYIDEVDQARRVVDQTVAILNSNGVGATGYHDNQSHSQNENLNRIVDFHNSKTRDLDISVHFNAYETTSKAMGTEVLYASNTGSTWANTMVNAIANVGFVNRGPKKRTDLFFLNNTEEPAILIEVCFVDSKADTDLYNRKIDEVCEAIAEAILGEEIDDEGEPGPEPEPEPPSEYQEAIIQIAMSSRIAKYAWKDRGIAPDGYIKGFALTWATVVQAYLDGKSTALEQAKGDSADNTIDALSVYDEDFNKLGMSNEYSGINTLRHLYALMYGAGMRESSGQHCCGRDQSADNVESDTAEAGLFQTSYNAHTCSPEFTKIMDAYAAEKYPDYLEIFQEEVSCSPADWDSYGSGKGKEFQDLCKNCPPFSIESAAITFRNRCQHYGPIKRKEVELKIEADWMLLDIQRYVTYESGIDT